MRTITLLVVAAIVAIQLIAWGTGADLFGLIVLVVVAAWVWIWRTEGLPGEREPLLTDVAMIAAGPIIIAIGYLKQFNNIPYPPGDYRATPASLDQVLWVAVIIGIFLIVVGSIRLVQGLRDLRRRP